MSEDTTETLDKLVGIVQNYKSKDKDGKGGWIAAAISAIVALLAIAMLAYRAWKAGKARAAELHQKALLEEQKHQAEVDASLATSETEKQKALDEVADLELALQSLEKDLEELQAERDKNHATIGKITSWEDVDALVK